MAGAIPLAFLTGLTRITGAALVPALLVRAWRRKTVEAWLLAIAPAVGLAAHAAWLWHAVGDPLAMVKIQSEWGGHLSFPLWPLVDQFWRFATTHDVFYLARGVTVIAYLLLLIPIWKSARSARTATRTWCTCAPSSSCRCSPACSTRSAASAWSRSR